MEDCRFSFNAFVGCSFMPINLRGVDVTRTAAAGISYSFNKGAICCSSPTSNRVPGAEAASR